MKTLIQNKRLQFTFISVVVYALLFVLKNKMTEVLYQDEIHFFETTKDFSNYFIPPISYLKNYPELNTPLPFIIGGWWIVTWGGIIQNLRILTLLLSFSVIMIFIWNSTQKSTKLWYCLLGLWLFPNYYLCTVYYYTDMFAILFSLLGILAYLKSMHVFSGLALICAICSRQYMIAFPAAIIANEVVNMYVSQHFSVKNTFKSFLSKKYLLVYIIAFLSIVPWVILWGGFAPSVEMKHQYYDSAFTYKSGFVLYSSAVVAFYFALPEMIFAKKIHWYILAIKNNKLRAFACLVLVMFLVIFTPAEQTYNPYFTWKFLGYLDMGLVKIGISGGMKQLIFGFLMFLSLIRFLSSGLNLSSWVFIINGILLGKAQLSWDKYSLPTVVILWFLVLMEEKYAQLEPSLKQIESEYEFSSI